MLARLAGIVADGGRCVSDLVVLAGQGALFGVVASVLMASFDRGAAGAGDEVGGGGVVDAVARLDGLVAERH